MGPEFTLPTSESEGYIQSAPKTISGARALKSMLRKQVKKGNGNSEDRKQFAESVRYHKYLLKQKRKTDLNNKAIDQERQYKTNFWQFAKKACKGSIGNKSKKASFSKETADTFYPSVYSNAPQFDNNLIICSFILRLLSNATKRYNF